MNGFDQQKAARVWQRVQQAQPREKEPDRLEQLPEWLMNAWTLAAIYRQLAAGAQGTAAELLKKLARQAQKHAACLGGIRMLTAGEKYRLQTTKLPKEPMERVLRRCCGMHLRNMKAYEARSDDPEYGPVLAELARQEREQAVAVLELLGGIGNKPAGP